MRDWFDSLVTQVDDLLGSAAADPDSAAARAQLVLVADALASAPDAALAALAHKARLAADAPDDETTAAVAYIDAAWNGWKASQIAGLGAFDDSPATFALPPEPDGPMSLARAGIPEASPPAEPEPCAAGVPAEQLEMLLMDPELAGMFIGEALDHLSSIEALVLQLEAQPGDEKLLNDIFRPFHTIKGNAGALGVTSVQECAHRVENLLDLGRSGRHAITGPEVEVILRAVDVLSTMVRSISAQITGQPGTDIERERLAVMAAVEALIAGGATPRETPALPAEIVTAAAPESRVEPDVAAALVAPVSAVPEPEAPVPVQAPRPATPAPGPAPAVRATAARAEDPLQASVKVDTRKLDNLVDAVGELVIVQSMIQVDPALAHLVDERLARNLAQLKRITTDLQRNAMAMRMTPIRPTFQKMARLVRDLAKKSGKQIELALAGEDTELDRKVVEDINDPLMHMVRNSVDHGIEPLERRLAAGKPAQARVELSAYHEGGNIVIAISDDGGGLDTERIRAKAVAQGIIGAGDELTPAEIHHLIFMPGFSTAEKITEISGRGVGMDVVRRNIEALRGRVEIQTELGAGTTFFIKLPLTLAILEGLLLRAGTERFVLPTFCVRESLRPTEDQIHSIQGRRQMIKVRDSLLPLVHLGELFGQCEQAQEPWNATVVVVEDNGRSVGLLVDELLGKQEVVIKSLGEAFSEVRGVAGGAILGDGRIGLILDAGGLLALMGRNVGRAA